MEATLRTVYFVLTGKETGFLDFEPVRDLEGVKEASVNINGQDIKVAIASGMTNAKPSLDDIMTYLMSKGVPNDISFKVMEDVRKGKGLKKEYLEEMKMHGVPKFYIDSCNKIKYLFPRAHATAYVTQAVRVGYFKIYYPLAFYDKEYKFVSLKSLEEEIVRYIRYYNSERLVSRLKSTPIETRKRALGEVV